MIRIVTTFSRKQWDEYVHVLLPKSMELWPKEVEWQVWLDSRKDYDEVAASLKGHTLPNQWTGPPQWKFLDDEPEHEAFMAKWNDMVRNRPNLRKAITTDRHAMLAGAIPQQGYTFDAGMFAHKVFALTSEAARDGADWLIFLGSDVETLQRVEFDWLRHILDGDIVHLGRRDIRSSETDWLAVRNPYVDTEAGTWTPTIGYQFLKALRHVYTSGDIFQNAEWIDGFVTARLINVFEGMGATVKNLSAGLPGLDIWDKTILGEKMRHWKGHGGKKRLMEKIGEARA